MCVCRGGGEGGVCVYCVCVCILCVSPNPAHLKTPTPPSHPSSSFLPSFPQITSSGLVVGDEILVINGKIVSELDMVYIETLLHESRTLFLTVRSMRTQPPPSEFITQHTDSYISNMVCPPPPSQPRISEKSLGNLIVPAPSQKGG